MNLIHLKYERAKAEAKRTNTKIHDLSDFGVNLDPHTQQTEKSPQNAHKVANEGFIDLTKALNKLKNQL